MPYAPKDYTKLVGMEGFSETILKNHFTLYQGYVTNTNKVLDTLDQMSKDGKTALPEFAELKRRLGWEFNGMRLHEYYFENLGSKGGISKDGKAAKAIAASFGSIRSLGEGLQGHRGHARHRLGRFVPGHQLQQTYQFLGQRA